MKKLHLIIVMVIGLVLSTFAQDSHQQQTSHLVVRVHLGQASNLAKLDGLYVDLISRIVDTYADVIVCNEDLDKINRLGFRIEILDTSNAKAIIDPEYHTYQECIDLMHQFANDYPEITVLDTIGTSHVKDYYILSLKISDNPEIEEDEMAVLYDGMHHAREPVSTETCLVIIEHLLTNYGIDPEITAWIDTTEIFVVPMLNPDGWMYVVEENLSNPWWRKNIHDNNNNGVFDPDFDGVDLNANYDINWEHGISDPSSWEYRGESPFSEKETQAKRDLALEQRFVISNTYHSYGQAVYYLQGSLGIPAPDTALYLELATEIASRIPDMSGGTYDLWEDDLCQWGYSDCWMYFTQGTFEFTIETAPNFIPVGQDAITIAHDNIDGALYLLERINGPGLTGHVTDMSTGEPLVATIKILDYDNEAITPRTSGERYGRYTRLLLPGTYTIEFSKDGYIPETISNFPINEQFITWLDISLSPDPLQQQKEMIFANLSVRIVPNPVHSFANIRYSISDPSTSLRTGSRYSNLTIYDAYGRLIETLVDGIQLPDEYTVSWNAERLPAGVYIYRLLAGDEVVSGKIIKH